MFQKTDGFVQKFIRQQQKEYNPNAEFFRFTKLYNHFGAVKNEVKIVTNKFGQLAAEFPNRLSMENNLPVAAQKEDLIIKQ